MMLKIEQANNVDGLIIFLLEQENYPNNYYNYRMLIKLINNSNYYFHKLLLGINIIGYFIVLKSGDDLEIIKLTIKKIHHKHGYGFYLLKFICESFAYEQIFLEVNENNLIAQKLYQKMGFNKIREINNYYGTEKGYVMNYKKKSLMYNI